MFAVLEDEIKLEYEQLTWSFLDAQPSEAGWIVNSKFKTNPFENDESIIVINVIYDNSEQTYCSFSKVTALKTNTDSNALIDGKCSTEEALNSEVDRSVCAGIMASFSTEVQKRVIAQKARRSVKRALLRGLQTTTPGASDTTT